MTVVEVVASLTLVVTTLGTVMLPLVLRALNKQDADRTRLRDELHGRLDHLDACFDSLRARVMAENVTRKDLAEARAEINETLSRMRQAISADTNGLHDRIFRIEGKFFKGD